MVHRRPSLPIGHSFSGLPPIRRALHSDDRCELYALDSSVLLLSREPLTAWWTVQASSLLTIAKVLPNGAVLVLNGSRIEDLTFAGESDDCLHRLFVNMIELVDRTASIGLFPDFDPALTLHSNDSLCCLMPMKEPVRSEAEQVRTLSLAFFRCATGVTAVGPLRHWAKHASQELSSIVARCLSPKGIASIGDLKRALGLSVPVPLRQQDVSSSSRGLSKVAGMHALKELLQREIVEPVRNPEPYRRYGLSIPNGVLLFGPPGCGKTYIARQLAEELGHHFIELIPSEIGSPYIHQSVLRIREIFDAAESQAPSIIFIDEFDALVPSRSGMGGHQQYKAEEVNEFLAHLNGCSERRVLVIAATNQADRIDPAVRRTGRLDKIIYVGAPDLEARREMLELYLQGRPVSPDLNLKFLAELLAGYSASDIRFLVDEAARGALRKLHPITEESFVDAISHVPASVPPELEASHRAFEQRGL